MKIFSAQQIKAWDAYTIAQEPIASVQLMERAAKQCVAWLQQQGMDQKPVFIFCGKGNNGGDGLAIARMLLQQNIPVHIYILEFGKKGTEDFQTNLQRLHALQADLHFIQSAAHFPPIEKKVFIIDALFGSGLNQPLDGLSAELVQHINSSQSTVISIDVPSGLFMDASSAGNTVVKADYTLTFQSYKLALLLAENADFLGEVSVLDIGLHPDFPQQETTAFEMVDERNIRQLFKPRNRFAHKGIYGHALLIGGSWGKMGAVVLATKAGLRTGAGLVTAYIPQTGYNILQTAVPEAMVLTDAEEKLMAGLPDDIDKYAAIGVGPGLGTDAKTIGAVTHLVQNFKKPLVLDADALNCLSLKKELLQELPSNSIITPHPKEFERLFGATGNEVERIKLAKQKAGELGIIIVLKGHHSLIALPDGRAYFNSTGNAGMAKGGSGDVLTGMITALLSQGYSPADAAVMGVYLHGWAGDFAAQALSKESILATDLIRFIPQTFLQLNKQNL